MLPLQEFVVPPPVMFCLFAAFPHRYFVPSFEFFYFGGWDVALAFPGGFVVA
jgi:hypothetical protein